LGLLKIKPKFSHSKVHNYLLVKAFVVIFSIHIFFSIMYHILNPYKKYWGELQPKMDLNVNVELSYNPYVHFKSLLLYDWCMFIEFHPLINIIIQVGNFNP
jgi:hypothetical protein